MNKDELKVLFVGNSFSDNLIHNIYPVAKAFGYKKVKICNLYIGGCTVETHYDNMKNNYPAYIFREVSDDTNGVIVSTDNVTMEYGFLNDVWDYISFQQASHYSGLIEKYQGTLLDELIDYAKSYSLSKNPNLKFMWHMTWAYQQDATHPDFYRYDNSQKKMFDSIVKCIKDYILPNKNIDYVIPSGLMIQNLRSSSFGDTLTSDGYHLNIYGETGIAISFFVSVFNKNRNDFNDEMLEPYLREYVDVYFESAMKSKKDLANLK